MSERQAGDDDFEAVFRDLLPTAIAAAQRILGERAAAEDAAAEAFARAYVAWRRVSALPYRDAWILRVTVNQAIDAARRRPRWLPVSPTSDPSDPVATRLALAQALRALPRRQRDVIVLRHLGGFSEAEVAEALDLSENTVKTHNARGMAKLREKCTCLAVRKLTAKILLSRKSGSVLLALSTQISTNGGLSEREVKELTVKPEGFP